MRQLGLWGPACPPTLRTVVGSLRGLNRVFPGPIVVSITPKGLVCVAPFAPGLRFGRETLPGSGEKFDAIAAGRRLLAAMRDQEPSR